MANEIPKFYGPLADKLLRAYLALPEKSPLRLRFERLMVAEDNGEQQVATPDTPSGKFAAMGGTEEDSQDTGNGGEDMGDGQDMGDGEDSCCSECGGDSSKCGCGDGEDNSGSEDSGSKPVMVVVASNKVMPKKGMPLSKNPKRY